MPAAKRAKPATGQGVAIALVRKPARKDLQFVWRGLNGFNRKVVGRLPYSRFLITARSPRGALVGGLEGVVYYHWMFVANLFLSSRVRRGGVGSQLMAAAERHAAALGCTGIWLDTFTWQARPFYEKLGFRVFGGLPDYPAGHGRWFLMKRLKPAAKGRRRPPATPTRIRRGVAGRPARP
jgi:GNAT superfamily N-acetyltransferase